jgi:hypothetical protein
MMLVDRSAPTYAERLAFIKVHRRDPAPGSTRGLEQACTDCGRWEAAGYYCTWCYLPTAPADWYPWGSDTARRAAARAAAAGEAQTPPKRLRGRQRRSALSSKPEVATSRHLGRHGRSSAGSRCQVTRRTLFDRADRVLKRGGLE